MTAIKSNVFHGLKLILTFLFLSMQLIINILTPEVAPDRNQFRSK